MNVIILSPHFPPNHINYARAVKSYGDTALGIGDSPWISDELRDTLDEYVYVPDMTNYDAMLRTVAYLTSKYGKIDRIERDEEHKTITVSDFKTTKPKFKWSEKDGTLKHKLQLYFYKFLIENSREYAGYRVTKGRIDFVSPDNSGYYHALELDFDDEEAARIKQLIKIVYQHIKDLDFPDVAEYNDSPIAFIQSLLEH